jgi:outer membrane receptor protein involved in Fe transport
MSENEKAITFKMKTMLAMLCLAGGMAMAQSNNTRVTGVIQDSQGSKIPFANVFLYAVSDSVFKKAVAADAEARFSIEDAGYGNFYVKVTSVGYSDYSSPSFILSSENPHVALDHIQLKDGALELAGVQVTARKPFIEQHLDKMVLNVENSISSGGNSALEILEKAPGVMIDRQSDQIRIRNKSGVIVMIDGKITQMTDEALTQYLSNLSADQISSIEVITNPSARYDAAGNSGIINIRLKKNQNYGTNGTVSISAGTGILENSTSDLYRGNVNLNLNHRNEKWNLFSNLGVGRNRFYNDNHFIRTVTNPQGHTDFDQYTERMGGGRTYNAKLGADYFLTSKTSLGVQADIDLWDGEMISRGTSLINESRGGESVLTTLKPNSDRTMGSLVYATNLNLRHKNGEKEVSADLDYTAYRTNSDQIFNNHYYFPGGDSLTRQQVIQPSDINILTGKIDFTIPFENKLKLDFGAKTTFVTADNDFTYDDFKEGSWIRNPLQSNHFSYKESIQAAYLSSAYQYQNWSFQAGLRGEYTISEGHSITLNQKNKRAYFNLFPTGYVNYKWGENHQLKFAYSRRIDRPNYGNLNPFIFYLDPYFYIKGNPDLKPQFTHSNELTYTLKDQYSATLAYSATDQVISEVISVEGDINIAQNQNIAKRQSLALILSLPWKVTSWWSGQNNINFYQSRYSDSNVGGNNLDNRAFTVGFNTTQSITLPKKWTIELNYWYSTPGAIGIFRQSKPQHSFNPGVQKNLGKVKAKLNISDVFLTSFFQGYIDNGNIDLNISNRWNARRVALSLSYNFGNQNVKASNRKSASEEEKRRAAGS